MFIEEFQKNCTKIENSWLTDEGLSQNSRQLKK